MPLIKSLANNDTHELIEIESELTIKRAMDSILIKNLNYIIGKKNTVKAISFLLLRLAENFNVGKKLTDTQSATLAMDLFEIFRYESLEDVMLMLKMVRQGKIGDGKDFKLDGQTVLHKWVPEYLNLKAELRENDHLKNKGVKNGMANFQWEPNQVENFKLSNKVETIKQGFGSRIRKAIDTPNEYKSPIQDRKIYLKALEETCKKVSMKELKMSAENLTGNSKEADALEIIKAEVDRRNKAQ